jgi:hypothetical protein
MEPLNFCRQVTKQYSKLIQIPSLDETLRARMSHVLDLAAASQKFMLPDGGLLMDDPELRAIDEKIDLRLPHKFIALEFMHADSGNQDDVLTRRILFARERDGFIQFSGCSRQIHDDIWVWLPECAIPITDYLDRGNKSGLAIIKIRPLAPDANNPSLYHLYVKVLMCFLNALACSNVHIKRNESTKSGKKVKAALPFDSYHILTIDPGKTGELANVATGGGSHRSQREHLRRGHIRRLADGRKIWVNATVVCAGRGFNKVEKDYRIKNSRLA